MSSNETVKTMDFEASQVNAKLSSRNKVKRNKQKRGGEGVLDKSDNDQGLSQEVEIVEPITDQCIFPSNDNSKTIDSQSTQVNVELGSPKKRKGKKSFKGRSLTQEAVTVQPKSDLCPQSSNNFIDKIDVGSDQAGSSNKKKRKIKKQKTENYGHEAADVQSVLGAPELGSSRDSLMSRKQSGDLANEDVLVVNVVQPNTDSYLPSSNDFIRKMDTENDIANVELSSSNKGKTKRKKHKKGKNVDDKRDKDQKLTEEVVVLKPMVDLCTQSSAMKTRQLDDEALSYGPAAVGVQSVLEVSELGSKRDSSFIPKKQSDTMKNKHILEFQDMQPSRDMCQQSSHDYIKKMDTESGQANVEISSLKESKVKRKKQKEGNSALDRNGKDVLKEMVVDQDQPETDIGLQSRVSKCLKPEDTILSCSQEASCLESISEVAVLGSRRDNLMLEKLNAPLKNENPLEVIAVQRIGEPFQPSSNEVLEKIETKSEQVKVELSSSINGTIKRKSKKKKRGTVLLDKGDKDQDMLEEMVIVQPERNEQLQSLVVQPVSEIVELGSRKDSSLIGKQSDSVKNSEVKAAQSKGGLPLHDLIKKMDTETEVANAIVNSSSKKKRKRKKQKVGNDQYMSANDQTEEVVIVQPKNDLCLQSLTNPCSELKETVMNCGQEAVSLQSVSKVADCSRMDDSLMTGKQNCFLKNENISEVEAEQPKTNIFPHTSNEFNKEMDTKSNLGNGELSSSNKRKKKRKKQEKVDNLIVKSDKDQDQVEKLVIVQPKVDTLNLRAGKCLGLEDKVRNFDQAATCVQSVSEVVELGSRIDYSRMQGTQCSLPKNENTSEIKAVQPKRDQWPLLSNNVSTRVDMDAESDHVTAELSSSKKKRKKQKRQNVVNNNDDHMTEVVAVQPKSDPLLPSLANKCSELEDIVNNYDQEAVSVQTAPKVSELGSRMDNALMLGKEVISQKDENTLEIEDVEPKRDKESGQGNSKLCSPVKRKRNREKPKKGDKALMPGKEVCSPKDENTLEVEAVVQLERDMCSSSSTYYKKMDTEGDQVNAELCSSVKRKRKREKQKKGDIIFDKSYNKDCDLVEEVIEKPKVEVAELSTRGDCSLMPEKQSGTLNRPLCTLSTNGSIKILDSHQVNEELSPPNKKKRKRKKQEGYIVPNMSDKDLQEEVRGHIPDMAEVGLGLKSESKENKITMASSSKKLLILDINGLLVDIVPYGNRVYKPDTTISRKAVFKRPFCDDFLQFCFERFNVAVWSSRTKANLDTAVNFLMKDYRHKLVFCWDQSHCTRTKFYTLENNEKPLVLKELKKVWEKGDYNESNTLLVDDSPYKALRNPAYTAIFPHPYIHTDANDVSLGPGGDLRVYLEGLSKTDDTQRYVEENPIGQERITEKNQHWHFYSKILQIK